MYHILENRRVVFETPEWSGVVALDSTGNMIRLFHRRSQMEVLRPPESDEALRESPMVYGIALLFPPNRIKDGMFRANGREFRLPVNEASTHCALHGLVVGRQFELDGVEEDESLLRIAVSYRFDASRPEFAGFPCPFTAEIIYGIRPAGMSHLLRIRNDGDRAIPLGVGFHTAFATPDGEDVRLEIPHRPEGAWVTDGVRHLPDGVLRPWSEAEEALLSGRTGVSGVGFSAMYRQPEAERTARIHRRNGVVRYQFDAKYAHGVCWNQGGTHGFFCIEPMSWMTDAPNVPLPAEVSGFAMLPAHGTAEYASMIAVDASPAPAG